MKQIKCTVSALFWSVVKYIKAFYMGLCREHAEARGKTLPLKDCCNLFLCARGSGKERMEILLVLPFTLRKVWKHHHEWQQTQHRPLRNHSVVDQWFSSSFLSSTLLSLARPLVGFDYILLDILKNGKGFFGSNRKLNCCSEEFIISGLHHMRVNAHK